MLYKAVNSVWTKAAPSTAVAVAAGAGCYKAAGSAQITKAAVTADSWKTRVCCNGLPKSWIEHILCKSSDEFI